MMMNNRKEPDLSIERDYGSSTEGIAFYKDDECLEIQGYNLDGDSMLIILNPDEIYKLKKLLESYGQETRPLT